MELLIVGASARAAAFSARRAGWSPLAVDRFADADLVAVARCERVDAADEPAGLIDAASRFPEAAWLYTGALENRPDVIDALAAHRPLLGNPGATVRRVRDPALVAEAFVAARVPCPEVRSSPRGLPRDGSWLSKPRGSGGGVGVVPLRGTDEVDGTVRYYQRRRAGRPMSAVFLGVDGQAGLVGITRQLTGRPGAPFVYRGSVGPLDVGPAVADRIRAIGAALARAFGLIGLFGVDLILGADGTPWPVEVNPRYTASVEVLELAARRALLPAHRAACAGDPTALEGLPLAADRVVAKEIVYALMPVVFDGDVPGMERVDPAGFEPPAVADVPAPGTAFGRGDPVLTVFAAGWSSVEVLRPLSRARRAALGWLRPVTGS